MEKQESKTFQITLFACSASRRWERVNFPGITLYYYLKSQKVEKKVLELDEINPSRRKSGANKCKIVKLKIQVK